MKTLLSIICVLVLSGCSSSTILTRIDVNTAASDDCWVGEPCLIIEDFSDDSI